MNRHKVKCTLAAPITTGCDPEVFITSNGLVIGSEKVIPAEGIVTEHGKIVRDGVAVELQPKPRTCRQQLAGNISNLLYRLQSALTKINIASPGANLAMSQAIVVDVPEEEWEELSVGSKILGCNRSLNAYADSPVPDGAAESRMRCAGGHVHIATGGVTVDPVTLVKILDWILGIPSVLLDREPRMAERRRVYGRAGEYRLPDHGVEYRTLSNFWMRHYMLFSLVHGLAKFGVTIAGATKDVRTNTDGAYISGTYVLTDEWYLPAQLPALLEHIASLPIREVINENDFAGAKEIWKGSIRPFVEEFCDKPSVSANHAVPLWPGMLDKFDRVVEGGVEVYFPSSKKTLPSATHGWDQGVHGGWESWINLV